MILSYSLNESLLTLVSSYELSGLEDSQVLFDINGDH